MKKQILILAIFTMAFIFAGTNKVVGQLLPGVTTTSPVAPAVLQPIPVLSCIAGSEPLHPFAGVSYNYALDGSSGIETAENWTWWATKDQDFIPSVGVLNLTTGTPLTVGAGDLVATSGDYGVDNRGGVAGSPSVDITWSAGVLAGTDYQGLPGPGTPTFVVGYAEGVLCADNIQVYEINPLPNFTIDIAAINPDDDATLAWDDQLTADLCVDVVQSAIYNPGTYELDMDFGTNTFYFEVAAANFVVDWTPTFTLDQTNFPGLQGTQTAVLELYASLTDAQGNLGILGTNAGSDWTNAGGTWASGVNLDATNIADVATGVSVFVKVIVTNDTYESLTASPFVLAVDAQDNTETGIWDMDDLDCGIDPTTIVADQDDLATVTVLPRPQLDNNTIDAGIPNPTNRVPKEDGLPADYPRF